MAQYHKDRSEPISPELSVDWNQVSRLKLDTANTVEIAEIAPTVNSQPDISRIKDLDLENLMRKVRKQTAIFRIAQSEWEHMKPNWNGSPAELMAELVRLTEQFIDSDRIQISPALFNRDEKKRQLVITLNMTKIVRHFWQAIEFHNTEKTAPVLTLTTPSVQPRICLPWRTASRAKRRKKSHVNYCVYDSAWEASESFELARNNAVEAWVKNDHLGFEVLYVYNGIVKKYRPDFPGPNEIGEMLVLETKGQQTEQDDVKHTYMQEWISAVNQHAAFGQWRFAVSTNPSDIRDILATEKDLAA